VIPESKAIVIDGGGIAGLVSARVLCNHFVHVIMVERYELGVCSGSQYTEVQKLYRNSIGAHMFQKVSTNWKIELINFIYVF
jgi:protoporphyrinogen oxidase